MAHCCCRDPLQVQSCTRVPLVLMLLASAFQPFPFLALAILPSQPNSQLCLGLLFAFPRRHRVGFELVGLGSALAPRPFLRVFPTKVAELGASEPCWTPTGFVV